MHGENPYAPPQAVELESRTVFSHNHWKIYSNTLIVRNGATLPHVDLETGDRDTARHPIRLSPSSSLFGFLRSGDPNTIHAFVTTRTRFARIRRTIREVLFNISLFVFAISGFHSSLTGVPIVLFGTLIIWGLLDNKTKLKVEISAKPGWLRITEIHPVALAYLRSIAKPTSTS